MKRVNGRTAFQMTGLTLVEGLEYAYSKKLFEGLNVGEKPASF